MEEPVISQHKVSGSELPEAVLVDIDPEIRDIVLALNRQGLRTVMSCSGHPGLSGCPTVRGYLWFDGYIDKDELADKLKDYGLAEIKVARDDENGGTTIASFAPIGTPKRFTDFGSLIFSLILP